MTPELGRMFTVFRPSGKIEARFGQLSHLGQPERRSRNHRTSHAGAGGCGSDTKTLRLDAPQSLNGLLTDVRAPFPSPCPSPVPAR